MQKVKVKGWKVRVETDGQADGGDCISSYANAISNNAIRLLFWQFNVRSSKREW